MSYFKKVNPKFVKEAHLLHLSLPTPQNLSKWHKELEQCTGRVVVVLWTFPTGSRVFQLGMKEHWGIIEGRRRTYLHHSISLIATTAAISKEALWEVGEQRFWWGAKEGKPGIILQLRFHSMVGGS